MQKERHELIDRINKLIEQFRDMKRSENVDDIISEFNEIVRTRCVDYIDLLKKYEMDITLINTVNKFAVRGNTFFEETVPVSDEELETHRPIWVISNRNNADELPVSWFKNDFLINKEIELARYQANHFRTCIRINLDKVDKLLAENAKYEANANKFEKIYHDLKSNK